MHTGFVAKRVFCCLTILAALLLVGCRGLDTVASGGGGGGTGGNGGGTSDLPPTQSPVQRIIVVILQNASFDHLFGTFPGANGPQPGAPGYTETDSSGNSVTPFLLTTQTPSPLPEGRAAFLCDWDQGHMDHFLSCSPNNGNEAMGYYDGSTPGIATLWSYAQQFALADNYFHSVMSEAPTNQLYMVAGQDALAFPVQPFYGPCQTTDSAAKPYTFKSVGDQLTSQNIQWTLFAQSYGNCGPYNPEHNPFQYFTTTQNSSHIQDYSKFATQLANGTLPPVSFIIPDHAHDMHPGGGTVSSAVSFLSNLVNEVQNSSIWAHTAIVITWDTGGGWYDHVPPPQPDAQGLGFRVPLLVISPLAKKGYISHAQMEHISILNFIQWNWGLPQLTARQSGVNDIRDMFAF